MQNIEEIYNNYFKTVYKFLFCLTHNEDISEELTQETFCKAVQKIDSYKGECKISVWLCQIAKNLWYDECRKKKHIADIDEEILETIQENYSIEENIVSQEEKMHLYQKIQKLDTVSREVIYLRISGELSFKEIGTIMNKTENWARLTFYRAKIKLREEELL